MSRAANVLRGLLIYGAGDGLAAWLRGDFSWPRLAGMAAVGGCVYGVEVPLWFGWIDRAAPGPGMRRAALALLYFNPLWIARHLLFVECFSGRWQGVDGRLLWAGLSAFAANLPVSLAANYLIQNRVPAAWRFAASAGFSAAMAVYYSLGGAWFG